MSVLGSFVVGLSSLFWRVIVCWAIWMSWRIGDDSMRIGKLYGGLRASCYRTWKLTLSGP